MIQQDAEQSQGWLKKYWGRYQQRKIEEMAIRKATENVVEIADPHIRGVRRYWKALRAPVSGATEYCASLLEAIPGPVHLSRDNYHDDPRVKAVFASSDALEDFLRISPELMELRKQGVAGTVMALMTMSLEEKTIYGYQKDGDVVMRDAAQRAVNFYDHRLVAPSFDIDSTRQGVIRRGLEVMATMAMEKIETLQGKKAELQQKREYLRATLKILGGKTHMMEVFAAPEPGKWEEYRKAEKILAEVDAELGKIRDTIGQPEQSLAYLDGVLKNPKDVLVVGQQTMRLNWMNVRVEKTPDAEGNDITLAEFAVPEVIQRSALFVSFSGSAIQPAG
ncbi:hypothetical protein [Desulfopila aestuarii]|uniref:Uncharacterized protein n=1 Tax=Desulfopila aestuarii DSM 18488 TaxID=1121416 RepID=A0A1M7XXB5_9BACT|nr:hypothetical protein [Desulfopila aestuarii]SHO43532.1 hypothetical protein SAMN02745220_00409 [Desulfopila aestuarii DSM 18488]